MESTGMDSVMTLMFRVGTYICYCMMSVSSSAQL